jgi:hypothetical protein
MLFLSRLCSAVGAGMAMAWDVLYAAPLKRQYAESSKGSGNINGQPMKH